MASFSVRLSLIFLTFMLSSPLLFSSPSSLSPYQEELSPDIAPLLPSPGGVLPTPTGSDIPTIPSSPSPPNPDDDSVAPGPLSSISPFGFMQASSNSPTALACGSAMAVVAGLAACWLVQYCMRI